MLKIKKIVLIFSATIFLALLGFTASAADDIGMVDVDATSDYANSFYTEKIQNFDAEIKINEDSSLEITEKIVYDFGNLQKHGIYRDIPYKYKARGGRFTVKLSDFQVVDKDGNAYQYTVSKSGSNQRVKIGDPDRYVTGVLTYHISYQVKRALNYFTNHDELYWNVTGDEWQVPIDWSGATVQLPADVSQDQLQLKCYTGVYGSTASQCDQQMGDDGNIAFVTKGQLRAYEGLTIVVGWPKDMVAKPDIIQRIAWFLQDNYYFFFPFFAFFLAFAYWWVRGRDPKMEGAIVAEYEPPENMSPAELGTVLDGKVDNKDITAELIDLAIRGYLKIKQTGVGSKDYQFIKMNGPGEPKLDYDRKLMDGLFNGRNQVDMKDLKNSFYVQMGKISKQVYTAITNKKYYAKNPTRAKFGCLFIIGIILLIGSFTLGGVFVNFFLGLSAAISGLIMIIFSMFMPKRTKKGTDVLRRVKGFKEFLRVTEQERLKFHNPPKMIPEMFEKFLPYAMVLGVEGKWAKNFENIYKQQPNWYEGYQGASFNAVYLASSMSTFSSHSSSVMTSRPSSSASGGSGFSGGGSGGGGGGGGGGSW